MSELQGKITELPKFLTQGVCPTKGLRGHNTQQSNPFPRQNERVRGRAWPHALTGPTPPRFPDSFGLCAEIVAELCFGLGLAAQRPKELKGGDREDWNSDKGLCRSETLRSAAW